MGGKARKILAMGLSLAIAMQPVISVNASDDILSAEDENTQDFYDGIDENEEFFIDETMPNESVEKESDEFASVENNQESNLDDENIMVWGESDNLISNFATYTYGDYEYSIDNGNVTITKYAGTESRLEIPNIINGQKVILLFQ